MPERTLPLLRDLVAARTGMSLRRQRGCDLLRDRLAPLAIERGFDSLLDYYYLLKYDDEAGGATGCRVIDALSVQETYFWREVRSVARADRRRSCRALVERSAAVDADLERALRHRRRAAVDRDGARAKRAGSTRLRDRDPRQRRQRGGVARARAGALRRARVPSAAATRCATSISRRCEPTPTWTVQPDVARAGHLVDARQRRRRAEEPRRTPAADVIFCRNLFIYFTRGGVRRGRRTVRDRHAVARLPVRRRGRIAAAGDDAASSCRNLAAPSCTSSHDDATAPTARQPRSSACSSSTTRPTSARW